MNRAGHAGLGPPAPGHRGRRGARRRRPRACAPPSRAAGARCDLRFFEGEGHGFRRADTLTACLEAELAFYLQLQLRPLGSRAQKGVPFSATPCVRGFRDPCRNDSHDDAIPTCRADILSSGLWQWRGRPCSSGSPRNGRRAAVRGQRAVRAPHHLHVDQRALRGLGAHGAARRSPSARLASAVLAWAVRRARRRQPGHALTERQHKRAWARPHRGGGLRLRRRARHPAGLRDPVALRRGGRVPPAARGRHRRGRRAGPRPRPGPVPPVGAPAATR